MLASLRANLRVAQQKRGGDGGQPEAACACCEELGGSGYRNHLAGSDPSDRLSQLFDVSTDAFETRVARVDDNDANRQLLEILLIFHPLVDGHKNFELLNGKCEQLTVLERRPTLLLRGSDGEIRQVAPQLAWHVLVEKDSPHAICASAALPASSINATDCSRDTLG